MTLHAHDQLVLHERAVALARELEAPDTTPRLDVIEFVLANEHYAIETAWVREVYSFKDLTPLPGTPPFLLGIINVRSRLVAVIDLKVFFELPAPGITDLHRVLILQHGPLELGLVADDVRGARAVRIADLQPALPTLTGVRAEYLKGVTSERLIVLDAARILADDRLIVCDEPEIERERRPACTGC